MEQEPENGGGNLGTLSDQELDAFDRIVDRCLIESELGVRYGKLKLDQITEEVEFRKSGRHRRPPDEWDALWVAAVNEIGEGHGLTAKDVWELARNVVAWLEAVAARDENKTERE